MLGAHYRPDDNDGAGVSARVKKAAQHAGIKIERIPCPVDGSHTVYLHNLDAHLKCCSVVTQEAIMKKEPYYSCEEGRGGGGVMWDYQCDLANSQLTMNMSF